jgi:hypothetical protein
LGFGVWGLGFGVWGLGFGVWGWGLGFGYLDGLIRKVEGTIKKKLKIKLVDMNEENIFINDSEPHLLLWSKP